MHQEMWMMGYTDHGAEFDAIPADSFPGWKLRPLVPRPLAAASASNPHYFGRISGGLTEKNKREFNTQQVVASSRWNPTPEQLQTLEELYRRGTRTPSAEQIQHITAQLRRFGKIEGKNVFYWFQNHKARERQKRRRQLESVCDSEPPRNVINSDKKESSSADANGTAFEVEQTKNWASPTNCSTNAEKTLSSTQRAAKRAEAAECNKSDGWMHFDESAEFEQRRRGQMERNATWQMMHLSSCSSSSPTNLIMNPNINTHLPFCTSCPQTMTQEIDPNALMMKSHHVCNLFIEARDDEFQTLQLFPLQSGCNNVDDNDNGEDCVAEKEVTEISAGAMNSNFITSNHQFFEFLPLKN